LSGYVVVEKPSAELWDSFLKNESPEGNFLQCFEYGELVKTGYPRAKVVRLLIMHGEKPIGMAQGTYKVYFGFGTTLNVTWGPIVSARIAENLHPVENLLKELETYCRKHRIIELRFSVFGSWDLREVFHKMDYVAATKENEYIVNLEGGAQKLWTSIHHNKRRNIKRALEQGVEVTQSHNNEDLKTFYSLLEVTVKREGFTPYPHTLFEAIWNKYDPELSSVFLAKWKGKSISGVFVVVQGKTAYALNAGSLVEGFQVRPNDIMHWKAMEWACARGYSKYNLGGVSEPPPTEGSSKWGIWRWKREWKGNLERIEIFNKIILPQYRPILHARDLVAKHMR
jgi:lipid II:glycine glycyltransferase (peptidoglycan interpeptide bridge formation enzyme)